MDEGLIFAQFANALGLDLVAARADGAYAGRGAVVVSAHAPSAYLAQVFAAIADGRTAWLASPDWGADRMAEVARLAASNSPTLPSVMIPTGGSTGSLRFARHSAETLLASARGFLEFFPQEGGHRCLCVLPPGHVGGLMQPIRTALSGGRMAIGDPRAPLASLRNDFDPAGCFLSLVPTQLRRLLDAGAAEKLRSFGTILVGGAALDPALALRAHAERIPLAPSYGMTETAAVVAALRAEEFLSLGGLGMGVGRALPHARIRVEGTEAAPGAIHVQSASLCHAIVPGEAVDREHGLATSDLGWIDGRGMLHIAGRADRAIVSGGLKIDPGEIEALALSTGLVRDIVVIGLPDVEWGQAAVAFYEADEDVAERLRARIRERLSPAHVPKRWIRTPAIPRSGAGKPDIAALRSLGERDQHP